MYRKENVVLISPRVIRVGKLVFQVSSRLLVSPYDWRSEDVYPTLSASRWRRYVYLANVLWALIYMILMLSYCVHVYASTENLRKTGLAGIVAIGLICVALSHTPMTFYPEEFLDLNKLALRCMTDFQRKYPSMSSQLPTILRVNEWFLSCSSLVFFSNSLMTLSFLYILQERVFSITTVCSDLFYGGSLQSNWWTYAVDTVHLISIIPVGCSGYMVCLNIVSVFFFPAIAILQDLKKGRLFGPIHNDPLEVLKILAQMKLIVRYTLVTCSWLLGGTQMVLIAFTTVVAYCALRVDDGVSAAFLWIVCFLCTILLFVILTRLASLGELSSELISGLKTQYGGHSALIDRHLRAQKPIWIHIGNFYYYDRQAIATILMIIVNYIVNATLLG